MTATATITTKQAQELLAFCKANDINEFFLAKDQGAYFGAAVGNYKDDNFKNCIQYVKGCNPEKDEYWWEAQQDRFGGDDFGEHLPVDWLEVGLARKGKRIFGVIMTTTQIKLL